MKDEASRCFQTGHGQAPGLAEPHIVTYGELLQLRNNASGAASFGEVTRADTGVRSVRSRQVQARL